MTLTHFSVELSATIGTAVPQLLQLFHNRLPDVRNTAVNAIDKLAEHGKFLSIFLMPLSIMVFSS